MGSCAFDKLFTKSIPHILERIFLSLDYESFKNCLEVSKTWCELLKSESCHTKAKAKFQKEINWDEFKLIYAASTGNVEEVNRLLSSEMIYINVVPRGLMETPLSQAILSGHKNVVQTLLNRGADPNRGGPFGGTPLHARGCKDTVQMLLDKGANPKIQTRPRGAISCLIL